MLAAYALIVLLGMHVGGALMHYVIQQGRRAAPHVGAGGAAVVERPGPHLVWVIAVLWDSPQPQLSLGTL